MSLATDLMFAGMPVELSARLGSSDVTTIAGTGTTQATAASIPNFATSVFLTTENNQYCLILPSAAELMVPYVVACIGAVAPGIFPPVGGKINSEATDANVTITPAGGARVFLRLSSTRWISFVTA